ncbi:DUF982 domain-containing protein [Rhodobacteraceae bacterium R_SAG7]|jgi:hypothetical protein|uniref:DUF982 domain-containing protein n=1 Tax=Rhodobacterales TaxID=204455 RepID=UPI0005C73D45|nr:DUF982 domain-containing protein [Ruegeria sp. TM1040]MDF9303080.1 DUF982 domain-containing protein [Tritonibacter mobilis]NKW78225.1 DUF982 domain-containing protein [Rhodobacteraceae bacterium R_SAG7]
MIEIFWGPKMVLTEIETGTQEAFGTIEKAHHWLSRKWPVADSAARAALAQVEAAMECMGSVQDARSAFQDAACSAGFHIADQSAQPLAS